jgi:hypothetical protein
MFHKRTWKAIHTIIWEDTYPIVGPVFTHESIVRGGISQFPTFAIFITHDKYDCENMGQWLADRISVNI